MKLIDKIIEKIQQNRERNRTVIASSIISHARFVGEDGSLGLKYGKIYPVYLYNASYQGRDVVGLKIYIDNIMVRTCPYDSMEKFFENWEVV